MAIWILLSLFSLPAVLHWHLSAFQENAPVGTSVLELIMSDRDSPENGPPYSFQITQGNDGKAFDVTQNGLLVTSSTLNRRVKEQYLLQVQVKSDFLSWDLFWQLSDKMRLGWHSWMGSCLVLEKSNTGKKSHTYEPSPELVFPQSLPTGSWKQTSALMKSDNAITRNALSVVSLDRCFSQHNSSNFQFKVRPGCDPEIFTQESQKWFNLLFKEDVYCCRVNLLIINVISKDSYKQQDNKKYIFSKEARYDYHYYYKPQPLTAWEWESLILYPDYSHFSALSFLGSC